MQGWYCSVSLKKDSTKSFCSSPLRAIAKSARCVGNSTLIIRSQNYYIAKASLSHKVTIYLCQCIPPVKIYFLPGFPSCYYSQSQLDRDISLGITNQFFLSQLNWWMLWFLKTFPNPLFTKAFRSRILLTIF